MKQILYILGLALLFSGVYTSCKTDTLEALHQKEVNTLNTYIKDNNLTDAKDASGIYFKMISQGTDTTMVRKGFRLNLEFKIMLMDSTVVMSTEDELGRTYEPFIYYVDATLTSIIQDPVQQIAGLAIGLKKMKIGDTALIIIPSELAFKAVDKSTGYSYIPRFSTLIATVYVKSGLSPAQLKEYGQ